MKAAALLALVAVSACSFIGARVPDHPPAPEHCPTGVVMLDGLGTALFLVPPLVEGVDGLAGNWREDDGDGFILVGIPMIVLGSVYLASTIYGARAHGRCERMQTAEAEEAADAQHEGPRGPRVRARAPVVGDAPLYCVVSEPDVGACFAAEAACVEEAGHAGGTCEPREAAWCFDVSSVAGGKTEPTCAISQLDCDARRTAFASDASLVVTACGTYTVRAPIAP